MSSFYKTVQGPPAYNRVILNGPVSVQRLIDQKGGQDHMYVRFAELPVADQDRAIAFYTENLGFRVVRDTPYEEDGWRWVILEIPGAQTKILLSRRPNTEEGDVPSLVLTVDDVHRWYEELKAKGVSFKTGPSRAMWNDAEVYAVLRDSEGNLVMLGSEG